MGPPTVIATLDAGFDPIVDGLDPSVQVQVDIDLVLALMSTDHIDTATARDEMSRMDLFAQQHTDELDVTFDTLAVSDGVHVHEVRHVVEVCPPPISSNALLNTACRLHSNLACPKRSGTLAPVAFSRLE